MESESAEAAASSESSGIGVATPRWSPTRHAVTTLSSNVATGQEIQPSAGDELTGPEAAAILSEVTGRPITFYSVPIEEVRKGSAEFAAMLEWFDAVGYDADIDATSKEFGVRPTRFREWAAAQRWS